MPRLIGNVHSIQSILPVNSHAPVTKQPSRLVRVLAAMKVMLVEDDELVRATLTEGLEEAGLQVAAFSDPKMALCSPGSVDPPDVVITDVDLGSTLDGY